jgi:hypothetical protein
MSWGLMTAVGFGLMFMMRYTGPRTDKVLVRLAAAAFVGAGAIGAAGWFGEAIAMSTSWAISLTDKLGAQAFGAGIAWILIAALGVLWVGALLPDKVFKYDFPDWLVITGLVLPALLGSVPGPLGESLRAVVQWAGSSMNNAVAGLI